jgi:putative tricarboxylic transport membrane protein
MSGSVTSGLPHQAAAPAEHSTVWPGTLLLVVGAAAAVLSLQLGLTVRGLPGPGLWPFLASVLMIGMAVWVLMRPRHRLCEPLTRSEVVQVVPAVAILAAFVALLPTIGTVTACTLTGVAWLRFVAHEGWRLSLILPPALGFVIYLIFVVMLRVPLPVDAFLPR